MAHAQIGQGSSGYHGSLNRLRPGVRGRSSVSQQDIKAGWSSA